MLLQLTVFDTENPTSNTFTIEVPGQGHDHDLINDQLTAEARGCLILITLKSFLEITKLRFLTKTSLILYTKKSLFSIGLHLRSEENTQQHKEEIYNGR